MKSAPLLPSLRIVTLGLNLFTALGLIVNSAPPASAQTETVLYSFCPTGGWCAGGAGPTTGVIADSAGNLYGVTSRGGTGAGGIAFKVTPAGEESLLYDFSAAPSYPNDPDGQLILDQQGNLYGTTREGGTNSLHFPRGDGTAFKLSPDGTETTLYNFGAYNSDGDEPTGAGLVMDARGNFFGTTSWGGVYAYGTIFRLSPDGVETILHNFAYDLSDGGQPEASLIVDSHGNLYGTTVSGGAHGWGTVFELSAEGSYSILHSFDEATGDGVIPLNSLTVDSQGNLYGATYWGGAYSLYSGGTVFKLSPGSNGSWTEAILYNFGQEHGSCQNPESTVLFDAKGNLYGTTGYGGASGGGCAYKLSPAGKLTVLHAFGEGDDGADPSGNLVFFQGNLYGTTYSGGAYAEGTVFKITP
jgi:uncharacterized repeat protein (TIGR03803 family)